tara:strand:+ start:4774 stop:5187 length:414 start_codon:yes stop_codon:yes gene_type:complete
MLTFHALGMAFLVGVHFAVALRIFGVAKQMPLSPLQNFIPLMWLSFFLALFSGLMLLLAYPAKGLTNPFFYTKLIIIALVLVLGIKLLRLASDSEPEFTGTQKLMAVASVLLWVSVITLGRFLAYTYSVLMTFEVFY